MLRSRFLVAAFLDTYLRQMAITEKDIKLLWGRAAGRCSRPDCRLELTAVGEGGESFLTGEMAHQIAKNPGGPRGNSVGGSDSYDNLILLCPTHHREIDKAPDGTFPVELLETWKQQHEEWVAAFGGGETFSTVRELASAVFGKLEENRFHFETYGPKSNEAIKNPMSNASVLWQARILDTLLPNNRAILRMLSENKELVPSSLSSLLVRFKAHALGFEASQYDRLETYPLFPKEFSDEVKRLAG